MPSTPEFERVIAKAVEDRVVPGVVLLAENASGSFRYEKVLGFSSIEPGNEKKLERDSVFMFMSMTKLITAITAMQAVERGLWDLDADVAPLLPELAALPVLKGFSSDGVPELVPRESTITLRQLLSHTSGAGYDFMTPDLMRYCNWVRKQPPSAGLEQPPTVTVAPPSVEERFRFPLVFQPGQGWQYGAGMDWAGRLVERINAKAQGKTEPEAGTKLPSVPLEDIVVRDVLTPLGLPAGSLTFVPERYPDVFARLWPSLPMRAGNSGALDAGPVVHGPSLYKKAPAALGGQGLYGDMPSFLEVALSIFRDDGRLLTPASVKLFFEPQLASEASHAGLMRDTANSGWITGDVPDTKEYDWSVGGLLVTGHSHPFRKKDALLWAGAINLTWVRLCSSLHSFL